MPSSTTRGVYFLANDSVVGLTIAFLNSFRTHNPDIPLCLIPFATDIDELKKLQSVYNFSIYTDDSILDRCDQISRQIHHVEVHHYRKLAMWEGKFEQFVYIDVDTVVLSSVEFVFPYLTEYGFLTASSNFENGRTWVWRDTVEQLGKLTDAQLDFSANTGFVASRKGALSLDVAERSMAEAIELSKHMALECMEQSFLNYLIVTSQHKFTSLMTLNRTSALKIPAEHWAGRPGAVVEEGRFQYPGPGEAPALFVHWAGVWKPHIWWQLQIFLTLQKLTLVRSAVPINPFMPYRNLWKFYRHMRADHRNMRTDL